MCSTMTFANETTPYAKFINDSYLDMTLGMIQGDSTNRLSENYRACVKQDYPAMQAYTEQFLQNFFGQEIMKRFNENYHLNEQIYLAIGDEQTKLHQQYDANEKFLIASGFNEKMGQMLHVLSDKDFAKSQNQEQAFHKFHEFANERLKECVAHHQK